MSPVEHASPIRVAITGAGGQLGHQLVRAFETHGSDVLPLQRPEFDITRPSDLLRLTALRPVIVINSAAWTDVDGCARDPDRALAVNGEAAGAVARAAADAGALVVQVSTNEVFDGASDRPYEETDEPSPINAYGASKLAGERAVAEANGHHLIVRTAWLFGPGGANFVTKIAAAARKARDTGDALRVVNDEWGNPTWTPALGAAIARLAVAAHRGVLGDQTIMHVAGSPPASRYEWAARIVDAAALDVALEPISRAEFVRPSTPPARAVLATRRRDLVAPSELDWREPTTRYAREVTSADVGVDALR